MGFARFWRSAVTGLCFAGFWALALGAAPTLLAAILLVTPQRERRARRVRRLVSFGFRLLLRVTAALNLARFEIEGEGWREAARGRLIVANHPSFLDAVLLLAALPDATCVMKSSLQRHPLFAPFVRAGGYLGNASDPLQAIAECALAHARGEPILIFPEGTRTRPGEMPRFRRGAAQLALRAGLEILPATITCDPPALTHGVPWYRTPPATVRLVIRFHAPRKPAAFASLEGLEPPRAARRLTRGLQDYFTSQLTLFEHANIRPRAPAADCELSLR